VAASHRDRAASRAALYRQRIADAHADGDHVKGVDLAADWLKGELAKVRRRRPQDAAAVDAEITEKLAALAEAIPFYRPQKQGGR
jgi:hypothetical protein